MKILVAIKRVSDPDNANRIKFAADGSAVDTAHLEYKINPFDEYALETALRLTEEGKSKTREGEVVVVTLGPKETETQLRGALATGADRAIRIECTDDDLDGRVVAKALQSIVLEEQPDLVILGKQAVDGDSNHVAQALAELLDYPMATFAATVRGEESSVVVGREVDGGVANVRIKFPAVLSVDLRVVAAKSVHSVKTDPSFAYPEGVRFAALPAIMKAKRKPLDVKALADVAAGYTKTANFASYIAPPARKAGVKVADVAELVQKLANEAKAI